MVISAGISIQLYFYFLESVSLLLVQDEVLTVNQLRRE